MGLTFDARGGEDTATSFLEEKVLPLITKKPLTAVLWVSEIVRALRLDSLPLGGIPKLIGQLSERGDVTVEKGERFSNIGVPVDVELILDGSPYDPNFQLKRKFLGCLTIDENRTVGLTELEGLSLGPADVKWVKFIKGRGVFIRNAGIVPNMYLDWQYQPKDPEDSWRNGIDRTIEKLVGA